MNTNVLLKSLALVAASILVAGVFHVGWLAAFIPAAKSGVMALKTLGWMSAPVVTAFAKVGVRRTPELQSTGG
jgi:hypothetical protein